MSESLHLTVKYHDEPYGKVKRLEKLSQGDWIDVYSAVDMVIPSIFENRERLLAVEQTIKEIDNFCCKIDDMFTRNIDFPDTAYNAIINECKKDKEYYIKELAYIKMPHLVPLGFSMSMPTGYEGHLAPRSSTFKSFGLLQTNSVGVVDNAYCGDTDEWKMPVISVYTKEEIKKGDKIGQMRIITSMPSDITIVEVITLGNKDRGGFGSTGTK